MKIRAAVQAAKESGIMVTDRTDCRPTLGIDEAIARIEAFVDEDAEILFMDSPADDAEIHRFVAVAKGRPTFAVLSPGAPRETPIQARAAELGLKIGTFPTALLGPVAAAIKAGLAALDAGGSALKGGMSPAEFRTIFGYPDDEAAAAPFTL